MNLKRQMQIIFIMNKFSMNKLSFIKRFTNLNMFSSYYK